MLPLVGTFSKLNASNPTLILLPDSSGQNLVQPTLDRMGALAELLARLDAMPAEAVAWLQETLLDALHRGWRAMLVSVPCPVLSVPCPVLLIQLRLRSCE